MRSGRIIAALVGLATLLGAFGPAVWAQAETPPPAVAPETAALPEVTIAAPEPRWVAPTRRDRIGRIWAPVMLNGKGPYRLVLDTGANRSVIVERVAQELGDTVRTNRKIRVVGVTGTAVVPLVQVRSMEIGDLMLAPVQLPIVADVFGGADGILGNEGLRDKRIVIDFKRDLITVKFSRRERPAPGFRTIKVAFRHNHLITFDILVGRVRAKAILDTGAPTTLGNTALLNALQRSLRNSTETDIVGVTLEVERGNVVRMPTIRMNDVSVRGAAFTFSDVHIFRQWRMTQEPALMLGMDVLGMLDQVIIDYRTRELHLRTKDS